MAQERRTVTISVDGFREREVDYVHFELNQQTDVEGQPTGPVRGGKITPRCSSGCALHTCTKTATSRSRIRRVEK